MTSASHVATGATGATNVVVDTVPDKQVPARMVLTSSQDQQMGPNLVQVQHTMGSEQSDLSDDEFSVLEALLNSRTWKTIPRNTIRKLALDCFKSRASGTITRYLREVVQLGFDIWWNPKDSAVKVVFH